MRECPPGCPLQITNQHTFYCELYLNTTSITYELKMNSQVQQPQTGEVKVDTENFHQVLEHFDDEGHLKDKDNTRIAINCAICKEHDLAILNHDKQERSRSRHESYAVLKCGHAFGYVCLHNWLLQNKTCPSCRTNPFCSPREHFLMSDLYGDAGAKEQHEEIQDIRKFLQRSPECAACEGRGVDFLHHVLSSLIEHRQPQPAEPFVVYEITGSFTSNPFENPFHGGS